MADENVFSLERFEFLAYNRNHELAAREFIKLLSLLDSNYGAYNPQADTRLLSSMLRSEEQEQHLITRITSALSCLFADPAFTLSPQGFGQIISWQRWIAALFAASPYRNADHVIRALNLLGHGTDELQLSDAALLKFCMLFSPESEIPINLDVLWQKDKHLTAALACVLMSPRFIATPAAHSKRELLLRWFPDKLDEIEDISVLPLGIIHDVYMHCSYADLREKHRIKESINRLIRKKLLEQGYTDLPWTKPKGRSKAKPTALVTLEWFNGAHSVYRTHSSTMRELKQHFHVIGMGYAQNVDQMGRDVFDEFIEIDGSQAFNGLAHVRTVVEQRKPVLIYYPAVGMFPLTIFLSNLRLAPLQVTALGHGASTMSPQMDYYILDEDFIGDPACFSETLLRMPVDGMPHLPSAAHIPTTPKLKENPETVHIAVAATTMKLNPRFMQALRQISSNSKVPIFFEFLSGFAHGLMYTQVKNLVASYLPNARVHGHRPYPEYMAAINSCDMYCNPFPYGNMNGIADMTTLGLVGVNRVGPDVHEHIDAGMFQRLGLPEWMSAKTDQDYVNAAVRLAENHAERLALRRGLLARDAVQVFYKGRPQILGDKLLALARERGAL